MQGTFSILLCLAAFVLGLIRGQIPCDEAYGAHCPEEIGWPVGDCLKKQAGLSSACNDFISLQDRCKADIDKFCIGKEYTGDLIPCLTEWTKPADLSAECVAALPSKEQKAEKVLTKEELARAAKRRSRRKNAAKIAREF